MSIKSEIREEREDWLKSGKSIEEFKENIKKELEYKVNGVYQQEEFLETVDFVSFEVDSE